MGLALMKAVVEPMVRLQIRVHHSGDEVYVIWGVLTENLVGTDGAYLVSTAVVELGAPSGVVIAACPSKMPVFLCQVKMEVFAHIEPAARTDWTRPWELRKRIDWRIDQ